MARGRRLNPAGGSPGAIAAVSLAAFISLTAVLFSVGGSPTDLPAGSETGSGGSVALQPPASSDPSDLGPGPVAPALPSGTTFAALLGPSTADGPQAGAGERRQGRGEASRRERQASRGDGNRNRGDRNSTGNDGSVEPGPGRPRASNPPGGGDPTPVKPPTGASAPPRGHALGHHAGSAGPPGRGGTPPGLTGGARRAPASPAPTSPGRSATAPGRAKKQAASSGEASTAKPVPPGRAKK